jgi:hypothetical protein
MVLSDPLEAITWVLRIAATGVLLITAETLVRRGVLRDDGLMSWQVGSVRQAYLVRPPLGPLLEFMLRYPNICALLVFRGLLAAAIAVGPTALSTSPWCVCSMAVMLQLFAIRNPFGQDGADQMALIIFVGATVATLAGGWVINVYLWFIALQACLSYATAGIAKATAGGWWDGSFLVGIAATRIYGHEALARFLARRLALARALSIFLVIWECTFPLALIVPRPMAYAMVASGALFHLSNGILMGLNDFLWLFVATYPALLYCIANRGW